MFRVEEDLKNQNESSREYQEPLTSIQHFPN